MTIDDHDVAYAKDIAAVMEASGGHLTFYVNGSSITEAEKSDLAALAAAGHEIANHTWSHPNVTITDGLSVTSTNANPTVSVDTAGGELELSCDEVWNRVTVSTTQSVGQLLTAVSGKGWAITQEPFIQSNTRLNVLASTSGAQLVPLTLALDVSPPDYAFWQHEIIDNEDWLLGVTGVRPRTVAWTYGVSNAAVQAWARDAGLLGARGTDNGLQMLDSVNLYDTTLALTIKGDGSESAIRANARSYYDACVAASRGCLFTFLTHHAIEMTPEQVGWLVDEIDDAGGVWITYGEAIAAIRESHTTVDGLTYTAP